MNDRLHVAGLIVAGLVPVWANVREKEMENLREMMSLPKGIAREELLSALAVHLADRLIDREQATRKGDA